MDAEYNTHDRKIAALEVQVDTHTEELHKLRERGHDLSNVVATIDACVRSIEKTHLESSDRFIRHMDKEEAAFSSMYERLKSMDDELKAAFKQRDDKISNLDKAQVKLLAYMAGISGTVLVIVETAFKVFS